MIECGVVINIQRRNPNFLLNTTCLYDVFSLILTEPQTDQITHGPILKKEPLKTNDWGELIVSNK